MTNGGCMIHRFAGFRAVLSFFKGLAGFREITMEPENACAFVAIVQCFQMMQEEISLLRGFCFEKVVMARGRRIKIPNDMMLSTERGTLADAAKFLVRFSFNITLRSDSNPRHLTAVCLIHRYGEIHIIPKEVEVTIHGKEFDTTRLFEYDEQVTPKCGFYKLRLSKQPIGEMKGPDRPDVNSTVVPMRR